MPKEEEKKQQADQAPKDLMGMLDYYLVKKAPFALPANAKEWIVKFGPWIDVILLIIFLPVILFALGMSAVFMPFAMMSGAAGFGLASIIMVAQLGLMIAALPGLFARKISGWNLSFYSVVANLVYGLFTGAILSGLLGALVSLYILFQIKALYKK
jgi:hypothetical protein